MNKIIVYSIVGFLILLLAVSSFGGITLNKEHSTTTNTANSNNNQVNNEKIPEKCQIPAGQNLQGWKEHLSHHEETRDCLKYFN